VGLFCFSHAGKRSVILLLQCFPLRVILLRFFFVFLFEEQNCVPMQEGKTRIMDKCEQQRQSEQEINSNCVLLA